VREQLEAMGYHTTTEVLGIGLEDPTPKVRDKLRLANGAQVYAIHRLRAVQSEPISLHHSYVPATLAPGLDGYDTGNLQLCVILEKNFGLAMKQVEEHLEATAAGAAEAERLQMRRGHPVLLLEDVISDDAGQTFEYSTIVFRGDKVRIGFDYQL
ncbi:MAG TPA: UTRA domain-containing protein, partial [Coriobacteriia bacterium]|nr:UTRA domain-containing protein [Coriobacteriia bacterium]